MKFKNDAQRKAVMAKYKNLKNKDYKKKYPKTHWKLDSDGDGTKNEDDCYPFDPKRQHTQLNKQLQKEAEGFFFTSDVPLEKLKPGDTVKHFGKHSKKAHPDAHMRLSRALKDDPSLIRKVREMNKKRPLFVTYAENPQIVPEDKKKAEDWLKSKSTDGQITSSKTHDEVFVTDTDVPVEEKGRVYGERQLMDKMGKKAYYDKLGVEDYKRMMLVGSLDHELEHGKQQRRPLYGRTIFAQSYLPYKIQPQEISARKVKKKSMEDLSKRKRLLRARREFAEKKDPYTVGLAITPSEGYKMFD